ncbi:nuclear transport factor 2 family protein [Cryptosporangium phraense]|uniref:Nuclear transport factor 2 family protein n=1 Tax=Cryptosporangium phraense TaxID=2593070 RepID=A0A545AEI3_9ACTN|nr:nuclear transport factor 2 family protein [Cryptosporangium phraense]TQS39719.1 nuclear transport factor 2 family protein [Cryptosporangium phraense]
MSTPDLFRRLLHGLETAQWDHLADLYTDDARVTMPFALPTPVVLNGREAVAEHFARSTSMPIRFRADNVRIYPTPDPDVVLAEFDYVVRVTTTGQEFRVANIQYLRARDGRIAETHDYHDHTRLAAALRPTPST